MALTSAQRAALEHVRGQASGRAGEAEARCEALWPGVGAVLHRMIASAALASARVTLNFHPDRLLADGRTVARALSDDGRYRSQFETGVSNGSLTAYPGGERDAWEKALFGGAYQRPGVEASERPTYGALDLIGHPDGGSPRFGSCHFRLKPRVVERCTFSFGDSHAGPRDMGTIDAFAPVVAGLVEAASSRGSALGCEGLDVPWLLDHLTAEGAGALRGQHGRALDEYIEAQVHGVVHLPGDAELLVADPSFEGTAVERDLRSIGVPMVWHAGFELDASEVPAEFRGPRVAEIARRLVGERGGARLVDAALVGEGARSVCLSPERWADWGTRAEALQHLKQLWHVLVRFGRARG